MLQSSFGTLPVAAFKANLEIYDDGVTTNPEATPKRDRNRTGLMVFSSIGIFMVDWDDVKEGACL